MATYYTLLTTIGQAKIANAIALGQNVSWTDMAVGDGNGNPTTPTETQTALVHEVYRAGINQLTVDDDNPNYMVVELVIPTNVGGWAVNEVGIFDADGDMVAVANFPATYKPQLEEGSGRDLVVRIIVQVSNASVVTLKVNPAMVLASQKWVVDNFVRKIDHATETARGIIEIANSAEAIALTDDERALTPKKLDAALMGGNGRAKTPAQFNDSTSIATTEFVKRQGLQSSGFIALNAATTLTTAHAGASVFIGGTTSYTVTLPLASSFPSGGRIEFFFSSTGGTQTISRQGSDIIFLGGEGSHTSVSGANGDSALFVTNGVHWYAVAGTLQIGRSASFGHFFSANGYQKLPGGLIIQWGRTGVIPTDSEVTVVYPIAFPSAVLTITATLGGTDQRINGSAIIIPSVLSTTSVELSNDQNSGGGGFPARIFWLAIGY